QGDALQRRKRQLAVAQLRTEARVRAQRRRGSGQHTQEVRQLPAGGQSAAQHRSRAFRGGQVVVDLESAHRSLHRWPPRSERGRQTSEGTLPFTLNTCLQNISVTVGAGPDKGVARRPFSFYASR